MSNSSSPRNETSRPPSTKLLRMFRFGVVMSAAMVVISLFSNLTSHLISKLGKTEAQTATAEKAQSKGLQPYEKPTFTTFNNLFVQESHAVGPPGILPIC